MPGEQFLYLIAEVSIALIAFTTIVVVLRQMVGGGLSDFQILVVQLFTVCGFAALFLALLPLLLILFGTDELWTWRISNPLMILAALSIHGWYFRQRRRIAAGRPVNVTNQINFVTTLAAVLLLALGALGIVYQGSIAPYALGLVALLLAAATAFLGTLRTFISND
jgi:hypothetical protein